MFACIENDTAPGSKYLVRASYLQIYNEVRRGISALTRLCCWHPCSRVSHAMTCMPCPSTVDLAMQQPTLVIMTNQVISDLLKPERTNLTIKEDRRRGVFVDGLSEWVVRSPQEVSTCRHAGPEAARSFRMLDRRTCKGRCAEQPNSASAA